ncbi:MAG: glycosyltransferase family 1 protein [Hyphomicrobiales bacterium]|nr:MAG: glycosyltransferase family 1 protein [Hyphomicrobiales bacterium]
MALVVDGMFFQLAQSGIARVWRAILPLLVKKLDMPIIFLDRGGVTGDFQGIEVVPFPAYKPLYNPAESKLLEQVCQHYGAKVFASTYYSTPLQTPSLLLVYDMIPEHLDFDLTQRIWREKEIAIAHARRHVCISQSTRRDLLKFYPELDPACATVAYCGIDPAVFRPMEERAVVQFRQRAGLERPYYVFVGSRVQEKNYKNAGLFFDAVASIEERDFDVLCVGGGKDTSGLEAIGNMRRIVQMDLDDESLALAYAGAAALVYPSLYEGFGLPVAEAMSCECPVITTGHSSLPEVAGEAAIQVSGFSIPEMVEALRSVRDPLKRQELIALGKIQAAGFRWEPFADEVADAINATARDAKNDTYAAFYKQWAQLRELQGAVDVLG